MKHTIQMDSDMKILFIVRTHKRFHCRRHRHNRFSWAAFQQFRLPTWFNRSKKLQNIILNDRILFHLAILTRPLHFYCLRGFCSSDECCHCRNCSIEQRFMSRFLLSFTKNYSLKRKLVILPLQIVLILCRSSTSSQYWCVWCATRTHIYRSDAD